jgi:hypothetical protein
MAGGLEAWIQGIAVEEFERRYVAVKPQILRLRGFAASLRMTLLGPLVWNEMTLCMQ